MTAEIVVDIHGYSGLGAEFVKGEVTSTGMRVTIRGALADALSARTAELEKAVTDAIDMVKVWGSYADDYAKAKHGFERDLAELRAVLERK